MDGIGIPPASLEREATFADDRNVFAHGRPLSARIRDERGFGMIELLAAMTVMLVGIVAVFGLFRSGLVQLRRASTAAVMSPVGSASASAMSTRV